VLHLDAMHFSKVDRRNKLQEACLLLLVLETVWFSRLRLYPISKTGFCKSRPHNDTYLQRHEWGPWFQSTRPSRQLPSWESEQLHTYICYHAALAILLWQTRWDRFELLDAEMFCCKGNIVSLGDDSSETVFLDIILGAMSEEISRMTCLQLASVPSIVHP